MADRLIPAIFLAPLIAAMAWSFGLHLVDWITKPYASSFAWRSAFALGMVATCVGIATTALIGVGAHTLLLQFQLRQWLAYAAAGALSGVLLCVLSGLAFGWGALVFHLVPVAITTAIFFWLIRRPDRDAGANPPTSAP